MKDKFNHVVPKGLSKAFHFFQMKEYIVLSEGAQGAHAAHMQCTLYMVHKDQHHI